MALNYRDIGLKVGLEIHFQLDTGRKLFCKCPPILSEEVNDIHLIRRLRPTQSELGQIDPAAYFEFKKGVVIEYISPPQSTCLVELDEEPPHKIDMESLRAALRLAKFFHSEIVDEVHVMRKIVVDGSNTTGFQRTSVIALGGSLYIPSIDRRIGIQSICLEEEAARLIKREDGKVVYCLDRLGIPLIEVATDPDIHSPDEAVEVAKYIGGLVTMTGVRKRGLGTIRQDINVSISGGPVVEIKGVQRLQQLKAVIEFEVRRQYGLMDLAKELTERGVDASLIKSTKVEDVSDIFKKTKNRVIRSGLSKGYYVYAVLLPGFGGLLGREVAPNHRLGKELAERIRFWTGLGGLFHTDEMPKYGITSEEINSLKQYMGASDNDAIVFFVADKHQVDMVVERIIERAIEALKGVPKETRGAREDGSTFYMRPRPGMARMYPETDIPPILIDESIKKFIEENPLRPPDSLVEELVTKYDLPREVAWKLFDMDLHSFFERLVEEAPSLNHTYIASFLSDRLPYILSELGLEEPILIEDIVLDAFRLVEKGVIFKESLADVIMFSYREGLDVSKAVEKLGLVSRVDYSEVKQYLLNELRRREDLKTLPKNILVKRLMAIAMSKYRGTVDPKKVVSIVNELVGGVGEGEA